MTVSSTTRKAGPYTGNGSNVTFPFSFKIFATSDVVVTLTDLTGLETTKLLTTDYTVSMNADQDASPGGNVVMTSAPASGYLLTLTSNVPLTQAVTLTQGGAFYPTVLNDALDRVTILAQQLAEKVARTLQWPVSSPSATLPSAQPGKFIGWGPTGTGLANLAGVAVGDALSVSYTPSGTGAVATTVQTKLRESVSVLDFGAVGDGVTDDTAAIQAAYDSLPLTGGLLYIPPGSYLISSSLNFNKRAVVFGAGKLEDHTATSATQIVKKATMTTAGIIITGYASSLENFTVTGIAGNTGDGIAINGNGVALRNIAIMKAGGNGLRIGAASGAVNCNSWQLYDVTCRANVGDGCYIHSDDTGSSINANAGTAVGVTCHSNGGAGLNLKGAQKNTFVGLHTEGNTGVGLNLQATAWCQLNIFIGGDQEGNTAGNVLIGAGAIHNQLINVGSLTAITDNGSNTWNINQIGLQWNNFGTTGTGITSSTKINNWFEEGLFTPTIWFGATELTAQGTPGSYTTQVGRFSRVGNRVFVDIIIVMATKGAGGGGFVSIRNLPYATAALATGYTPFTVSASNVTFAGQLTLLANPSTARSIGLYTFASAGALTGLDTVGISATSSFWISGSYLCGNVG